MSEPKSFGELMDAATQPTNQPTAPQPAPEVCVKCGHDKYWSMLKGDEPPEVIALRRSIHCLYLDTPKCIADDVRESAEAVIKLLNARVRTPSDRPAGEQARLAAAIYQDAARLVCGYCDGHFTSWEREARRGATGSGNWVHREKGDAARSQLCAASGIYNKLAYVSATAPVPAQEQEVDSGEPLPCPFCGAMPVVEKSLDGPQWLHLTHDGYCVMALNEFGKGKRQYIDYRFLAAWNTRARTSSVAGDGNEIATAED